MNYSINRLFLFSKLFRIQKNGLTFLEKSSSVSDIWTILFLMNFFVLFSVVVSVGYAIFVYKYLPNFSPIDNNTKKKTSVSEAEDYGVLDVKGFSEYVD